MTVHTLNEDERPDRLTQLLRERYDTGAYADTFLLLSEATVDAYIASLPPPPPPQPGFLPATSAFLWSPPLMLDASLPPGAWRLLDRTTGREVESFTPDRAAAEAHAQYQPAVDRDGDSVWLDQTGEIAWLSPGQAERSGWRRLYVRDEAGE